MLLQQLRPCSIVAMESNGVASVDTVYHNRRKADGGKNQGTTDWENQIDRWIHRLKISFIYLQHMFLKRSPAGPLLLENVRSPFYSFLTNREMLHWINNFQSRAIR